MLVTDKEIEKLAQEWNIVENREEAIDLAQDVRDIYEARLNEILKLTDKATKIIQDLRETHNDWR